ncbi:hypothetical protein [Halalkalibacillus sediminis]|nr:hypothetical protein [Halalkalibacillus sediminis]
MKRLLTGIIIGVVLTTGVSFTSMAVQMDTGTYLAKDKDLPNQH